MSKKPKTKPGNGQKPTDIRGHLLSSKTQAGKASDSESQTVLASSDLTPLLKSTVYTSIKELTMDKFITCACEHDLSVLIISGEPSQMELTMAWLNIKSQHIDNVNDPQNAMMLSNAADKYAFKNKSVRVNALLAALEEVYDDRIIEQLRLDEYDYPFTENSYHEDILKVRAELGSESLDIVDSDENGAENEDDVSKTTEQGYYNTIAALQKHFGLCSGAPPMKAAKELTVYEFGSFLSQYNKEIRISNNKKIPEDVTDGL